jgi:two-component system, OmpR family, alkaline phosphatase synthesis response regulator PhoP
MSKSHKILVVDDDDDILDLIRYNLEREGYEVKTVSNSKKSVSTALSFSPDLVILDIMMPSPNGIEICRQLRANPSFRETYIFFLTAKSENYYQSAAFDIGADDFVEKVMGLRALTFKINAVLKKHFVIRKSMNRVGVGALVLDRASHSVLIADSKIVVSDQEFELLFFFAQNRNRVISAENTINNIWGSKMFALESSIDVYLQNLKRKLGIDIIRRIDSKHYILRT